MYKEKNWSPGKNTHTRKLHGFEWKNFYWQLRIVFVWEIEIIELLIHFHSHFQKRASLFGELKKSNSNIRNAAFDCPNGTFIGILLSQMEENVQLKRVFSLFLHSFVSCLHILKIPDEKISFQLKFILLAIIELYFIVIFIINNN